MILDEIINDLAPFSDLGETPIGASQEGDRVIIRIVRNGSQSTLTISNREVIENIDGETKRHASIAALLSGPSYANLPLWASRQRAFLAPRVAAETLPITATHNGSDDVDASEAIDQILLSGQRDSKRNTIVVVDGPAGIGKTGLVRKLSLFRAERYRRSHDPLILHVESRGRVLQNISDLMAFSLQSLRLNVMFDQIPTLVKYGLVTLAIDGFDELGDPNGYNLAWAQLNDLISSVRGRGSFILSGRETFISGERILRALPNIKLGPDLLDTVGVTAISPSVARSWLRENGWDEATINSQNAEPIFERNSYALRPFFLSQLALSENTRKIASGAIDDTLSFLISLMLDREQRKFGKDVDAATSDDQRKFYIERLMEEVARDIADNQTDTIPTETLLWLSDAVSETLPLGIQGILRNRADVIAFLIEDDRRGYRKFVHEEVENYFLSRAIIRAIVNGEIPKFVRRNILGLDFLESFTDVVRNISLHEMTEFVRAAIEFVSEVADTDRAKRNISALVIASCSVAEIEGDIEICDVSLDEAYVTDTISPITLKRVTIAQLDARKADLRNITFDTCTIVTLLADDATCPSRSIPTPSILALPGQTITRSYDIEQWFSGRYWEISGEFPELSFDGMLMRLPIFQLFARFTRYKPFWLKDGDEKAARRILDDPNWSTLRDILMRHDLLIARDDVPAAGRPSTFYHLRNRDALANLDLYSGGVRPLVADLIKSTFSE